MLMRCVAVLACLAVVACNSSSDPGDPDDPTAPEPDGPPQTWTVFVYGHADHNLSPSLVRDMVEMSKAQISSQLTVIVMADWDASQKTEDGSPYPSGTEWYRMVGGGAEPELLRTDPEQNLDDPAVLRAAITRAFGDNPADRYGLVLWDHGGAWIQGFGHDSQNGTDPMSKGMAVAELASAVGSGMADAGLPQDRPLEFLAFDTCLMAGAEVAVEMASLSKFYIANAELDYGDGWDYEATLSMISKRSGITARQFAIEEVSHWDAHHANAGANDALLRSHIALSTLR